MSLFAATIFWFFNALNKNYSANINFPVAFDYDKENYIPVKQLPSSIRMNVSGLGWDLFRKSSGLKVPPLIIPLERPSETQKIVGSTLPALFSTQLEGLQINFVLTDTVYVDIDEKSRKKIYLKIDSAWQYLHRDFGVVNEIKIVPDTIWIEGPKRIVDRLPNRINLKLNQDNIDSDFIGEVEVTFPYDFLVKRDHPIVEVAFDVEKLMEVNNRVPLKVVNAPKEFRPIANGLEVNCTFRLPVSMIKTFSNDSLIAVINLDTLPRGSHMVVPVLNGLPKNARLIKIDSVRINF